MVGCHYKGLSRNCGAPTATTSVLQGSPAWLQGPSALHAAGLLPVIWGARPLGARSQDLAFRPNGNPEYLHHSSVDPISTAMQVQIAGPQQPRLAAPIPRRTEKPLSGSGQSFAEMWMDARLATFQASMACPRNLPKCQAPSTRYWRPDVTVPLCVAVIPDHNLTPICPTHQTRLKGPDGEKEPTTKIARQSSPRATVITCPPCLSVHLNPGFLLCGSSGGPRGQAFAGRQAKPPVLGQNTTDCEPKPARMPLFGQDVASQLVLSTTSMVPCLESSCLREVALERNSNRERRVNCAPGRILPPALSTLLLLTHISQMASMLR